MIYCCLKTSTSIFWWFFHGRLPTSPNKMLAENRSRRLHILSVESIEHFGPGKLESAGRLVMHYRDSASSGYTLYSRYSSIIVLKHTDILNDTECMNPYIYIYMSIYIYIDHIEIYRNIRNPVQMRGWPSRNDCRIAGHAEIIKLIPQHPMSTAERPKLNGYIIEDSRTNLIQHALFIFKTNIMLTYYHPKIMFIHIYWIQTQELQHPNCQSTHGWSHWNLHSGISSKVCPA